MIGAEPDGTPTVLNRQPHHPMMRGLSGPARRAPRALSADLGRYGAHPHQEGG